MSTPPQLAPAAFKAMSALGSCDAAQTLLRARSDARSMRSAASEFIATAKASGLPPDRWTLCERYDWGSLLTPPLRHFFDLAEYAPARAGSAVADAALALSEAGCSIWSPAWDYAHRQARQRSSGGSHLMAHFILHRVPTPLGRLYLQLSLLDPLSPPDFNRGLEQAYRAGIHGSSKFSRGILASHDKRAAAVCSTLCSAEPELLKACQRPGWQGLGALLEDAKARLASKRQPPLITSPQALRSSLSPGQRASLRSLSGMISRAKPDDALALAALESADWLKTEPNLACLSLGEELPSLFAQAMIHGRMPIIEWMERSGANIWLASAQHDDADACLWAAPFIARLPASADIAPIARMLLRDAWLEGSPNPSERCLELSLGSIQILRSRPHLYSEQDIAGSLRLFSAIELAHLDQKPTPARNPSRKTL